MTKIHVFYRANEQHLSPPGSIHFMFSPIYSQVNRFILWLTKSPQQTGDNGILQAGGKCLSPWEHWNIWEWFITRVGISTAICEYWPEGTKWLLYKVPCSQWRPFSSRAPIVLCREPVSFITIFKVFIYFGCISCYLWHAGSFTTEHRLPNWHGGLSSCGAWA